MLPLSKTGAEEESRTLDLNLGKVALYQLSYFRIFLLLTADFFNQLHETFLDSFKFSKRARTRF